MVHATDHRNELARFSICCPDSLIKKHEEVGSLAAQGEYHNYAKGIARSPVK